MKNKPILAYDTAYAGASIALAIDGHVHVRQVDQTRQAADLVPIIEALLREHGVAYHELGCIITTLGPGSFTGVRIGLAALHGFVLVAAIPIKLISTVEAVAWHTARSSNAPAAFYVTLRAGKGEVYAQQFTQQAGVPAAQGDIFLAPEGKIDWDLPVVNGVPEAATLCAIAEYLPAATLSDAVPLYIRPPDAVAAQPHPWLIAN
jgi:tRNA threonylcarbamoyl adenosine modification protein YeaZ